MPADSEPPAAIDPRSIYIARTGNASLGVCIYLQCGFGKPFRFIMARLAVNLRLKNKPIRVRVSSPWATGGENANIIVDCSGTTCGKRHSGRSRGFIYSYLYMRVKLHHSADGIGRDIPLTDLHRKL